MEGWPHPQPVLSHWDPLWPRPPLLPIRIIFIIQTSNHLKIRICFVINTQESFLSDLPCLPVKFILPPSGERAGLWRQDDIWRIVTRRQLGADNMMITLWCEGCWWYDNPHRTGCQHRAYAIHTQDMILFWSTSNYFKRNIGELQHAERNDLGWRNTGLQNVNDVSWITKRVEKVHK